MKVPKPEAVEKRLAEYSVYALEDVNKQLDLLGLSALVLHYVRTAYDDGYRQALRDAWPDEEPTLTEPLDEGGFNGA